MILLVFLIIDKKMHPHIVIMNKIICMKLKFNINFLFLIFLLEMVLLALLHKQNLNQTYSNFCSLIQTYPAQSIWPKKNNL